MMKSIHQQALDALLTCDPAEKVRLAGRLFADIEAADECDSTADAKSTDEVMRIEIPGRPDKPELVPPQQVKRRRLGSEAGRAALIHAIAHIEFNAINLALDAIYRFRDMPAPFYRDWAQVASEEAKHFQLLSERLQSLGFAYGDFPAHNGLWEMAVKTDHDVLIRMALVPRVLEARGLDVTPGMIQRLESVGDKETVAILHIILSEEIGHVAIGSHWFNYCCEQRGCDPEETFERLLLQYSGGVVRGPFNNDARLQAGFSETELENLANNFLPTPTKC